MISVNPTATTVTSVGNAESDKTGAYSAASNKANEDAEAAFINEIKSFKVAPTNEDDVTVTVAVDALASNDTTTATFTAVGADGTEVQSVIKIAAIVTVETDSVDNGTTTTYTCSGKAETKSIEITSYTIEYGGDGA